MPFRGKIRRKSKIIFFKKHRFSAKIKRREFPSFFVVNNNLNELSYFLFVMLYP